MLILAYHNSLTFQHILLKPKPNVQIGIQLLLKIKFNLAYGGVWYPQMQSLHCAQGIDLKLQCYLGLLSYTYGRFHTPHFEILLGR